MPVIPENSKSESRYEERKYVEDSIDKELRQIDNKDGKLNPSFNVIVHILKFIGSRYSRSNKKQWR